MRAVIQRVKSAEVLVDGKITGQIDKGLLVFLGVAEGDNEEDLKYILDKTINLRIFEDENEKMNLSIKDVGGKALVVSQFTIQGDARKGRRPSFSGAGNPQKAEMLYNKYADELRKNGIETETGIFAAYMEVNLSNDGPVTILLDSTKLF
jgi:D-tyrosyl-tRNA(Tyr) deacylase